MAEEIYDTIPTAIGNIRMRRLPDSEWTMRAMDAETLIVGAHEHRGKRFYVKVPIWDLAEMSDGA